MNSMGIWCPKSERSGWLLTSTFLQSDAALQQQATNLVEHGGLPHHPVLAHAMQGLQIY
jgi:hypothetical protein